MSTQAATEVETEAPTEYPVELQASLDDAAKDVRERILHLLKVYPYISRSMIQVGLSPALPPKLWDPVLQQLVNEKAVQHVETQAQTPAGRTLTKGIYYLPEYPFPPVTTAQLEDLADQAKSEIEVEEDAFRDE